MNQISHAKEDAVQKLIAMGLSIRMIEKLTKIHKTTVGSRYPRNAKAKKPVENPGRDECDFCGGALKHNHEFHRKTSRTKHKFCSRDCYSDFYRHKRGHLKCKFCGIPHNGGKWGKIFFSKGYCNKCYGVLRELNFNEGLAGIHQINQQLKKEIVKCQQQP